LCPARSGGAGPLRHPAPTPRYATAGSVCGPWSAGSA
jgi:hypothetical protein